MLASLHHRVQEAVWRPVCMRPAPINDGCAALALCSLLAGALIKGTKHTSRYNDTFH
jgi:hypothetical protein